MHGNGKFWFYVISSYAVLSAAAGIILLATGNIGHDVKIWGLAFRPELNLGAILFMLMTAHAVLSFGSVGATELGAITFFGRILCEVRSGLVFVPWGLCQLVKVPKTVISMEIPADPEKIFRGDGPTPEGMFPPIRITFKGEDDGGSDALKTRITAEVVPLIIFKIGSFRTLLSNVGSMDAMRSQLTDLAVAFLFEELPKISVATAMERVEKYNAQFLALVKEKCETQWGLKVDDARIKIINLNHKLNDALARIAEEVAASKAADATKEKERKLGEGEGAREKAKLEGRGAGLRKMREDLDVSGAEVLSAETGRAIAASSKTIIAGARSGITDLLSATLVVNDLREERERGDDANTGTGRGKKSKKKEGDANA